MPKFTNNNNFTVTLDGKDYTKNVPYPIKWSRMLDEQLDQARFTLKRLKRDIIHPLTPMSITMTDKKGRELKFDTLVTTDPAAELPVGNGTHDHETIHLEETKVLEGIVVDALTFTNDLGRSYLGNAKEITVNIDAQKEGALNVAYYPTAAEIQNIENSKSPKGTSPYTFISIKKLFSDYANIGNFANKWSSCYLRVTNESKKIIDDNYENTSTNVGSHGLPDIDKEVSLEIGIYNVEYYINFLNNSNYYTKVNYSFSVIENVAALPRWNIASVIDRVLDVAEPHLEGVAPRFVLNAEQHALFEQIEAPEFAFTNSTLKEILDQIGGYIHGIPRLRGNVIYFDMLGGTKQAKIANPKYKYISNMYSQDIENYCTSLDSTVDNLVCLTDRGQGTITEPYSDGGKSLRTETVYARVEEGNMFISTKYPIQEIVLVVNTAIPGMNLGDLDITPYVFEAAEYARQDSYGANYPTSKVYALYYTQGQKNIYGLNFKQKTVNSEMGDYSIIRILSEASGQTVGSLGDKYPALAFRVSYIPVFSARTQQTKQYIGDYKTPRALVYNQGANVIETKHFGENMKGAVARMGNVDRVVTYNLGDFSLIPEIGEMYGEDYYIAGVTCELYPNHIKCMLTLSKDFNRLSQYIGINSVRRFYEVSEKQAYRRDIKYADYLVIGDKVEEDDTLLRSLSTLKRALEGGTIPGLYAIYGIDHVVAEGRDENGGPLKKVLLPVVTTAQGNAMVFTFNYEDNYSAGAQVQPQTAGGVSGYFTNAVAYADYYGRMKTLKFAMNNRVREEVDDMQLPQTNLPYNVGPIRADTKGLVVRKDGREILSVNYVVEFVTNKRNYIIGSALARNAGYVRTSFLVYDDNARLYVLPNRIPKFAEKLDITDATFVWNYFRGHISEVENGLKFEDFTSKVDGEAWAVVNGRGEFYFGSNEPIKAGQTVTMPYICLRHDIYNLGGNNK